MKTVLKSLCIYCVIAFALSARSAFAIGDNGQFLVGYNEAWFKNFFSNSLDANPLHGRPKSRFNSDYLQDVFSGIRKAGGSVVRMWLVMDQQGLTIGSKYPQTKGISATMLANIETILQVARLNGLKVYFTLLEMDDQSSEWDHQIEFDYYWNLFNNKYGEGDAFNKNAVVPILNLLNSYQDQVYGLDLMNEINHTVDNGLFEGGWTGARKWIQRTAAFIKARSPWVNITSTVNYEYIERGSVSGLGLDFYDAHDYADQVSPSRYNKVCSVAHNDGLPVILGEFGQGSPGVDDGLQARATESFLSAAYASCFSAALSWRYDAYESQWAFINFDGKFRPAVSAMQSMAAISFASRWQGNNTVTRCGNIPDEARAGFWPQPGAIGCYTTYVSSVSAFPNCHVGSFAWKGAIYEERWGCGKPKETGFYINGSKDNKPLFQRAIWWQK